MKKDLFNRLKAYESYLTTAEKANFIRSLTNSQVEDLTTIGAELGINYKNNHCPKCALEFVKKLAKPYFEHIKLQETKNNEKKGNVNRGSQKASDNRNDSEGGEVQQDS